MRLFAVNQRPVSYQATALYKTLALNDRATHLHSHGVNKLSLILAKQLPGLTSNDLIYLDWGTKLHDLGKLDIAKSILHKPGNLTDAEQQVMQMHPILGFQRAYSASLPSEVTDIILYHHERYDGKGYPAGLKGDQIPLLARICSVADAFDAMVSDRPYRVGLSYETVVNELINNRGTHFCPEIVDCFLKLEPQIKLRYQFPFD